jgi:fructose-1-phosphate kinase PfkB-like protein
VVGELVPEARWLTISGYLPVGAPDDGYARLVRLAGAAGVSVALDARDEALAVGLAAGPDIVKVNTEEAGALLGVAVDSRDEARAAAVELRRMAGEDGRAGLVTRGAEGVVVVGPDGSAWEGRLHVRGPYPVGSGDAFLGGLVAGLERDLSWPEALALALGAATANAELPGAGRLDGARAEVLAKQAEVHPL